MNSYGLNEEEVVKAFFVRDTGDGFIAINKDSNIELVKLLEKAFYQLQN